MSDIVAAMLIWLAAVSATTMLVVGMVSLFDGLANFFVRVHDEED